MSRFLSKVAERFSTSSPDEGGSEKNRSAAHARRREQVRRAQKSHRERKAEYVKTLESEVTQLRENDSTKTWEIRKHKATIAALKNLLQAHGIEIPADIDNDAVEPPMAKIEVLNSLDGSQTLKTTFPTPQTMSQSSPGSSTFDNFLLSNPQVGINFVLALEYPCLPHFHPAQLDESVGHSMQLQAPLVAHGPQTASGKPNQTQFTSGMSWNIPTQELDDQLRRLLIYAQQLSLEGEMTPVMIWSRLQQHPQAPSITEAKLEEIAQALIKGVACFGFGAVIDEQFFLETLDRCLPGTHA